MSKLTPAMSQYYQFKKEYSDSIIFFRMGDFYETFDNDAKVVSKELDITLTNRGKSKYGEKMPLAGIPYHSLDNYLPRLIKKGYKVAICEQLEDPKKSKGVVKRGVVRVVTPGTAIDSSMFETPSNNYLMSIVGEKSEFGLSFLDISTGEFLTTQFKDNPPYDRVANEIARMNPSECIMSPTIQDNAELYSRINSFSLLVNTLDEKYFDLSLAEKSLKDHFGVNTLEGMGCSNLVYSISASGATIQYVEATQKRSLSHINSLRIYSESEFMTLDAITLRNLEVVSNVRGSGKDSTILGVLDETMTPMGSRMLKKWLSKPLIVTSEINQRLDSVENLVQNTLVRYDIRAYLSKVRDIERLTARIVYGNSNARDLVALKRSLENIPHIDILLKELDSDLFLKLREQISNFKEVEYLINLIDKAIVDEPPLSVREGGLINIGYNKELDDIRTMSKSGKEWIASFQKKERERTGIKSLKVGYNKVFGYYIEITKANSSNVPDDYIIKQTMSNSERFYTPELKKWEETIISADEKINTLEYEIFSSINQEIANYAEDLQHTSITISKIDIFSTFAEIAVNKGYTRPLISNNFSITIKDGRHPVVEHNVLDDFVPNDTEIDCFKNQFSLITGPNMAGKSTYMRQVALIVIMAQVGSFVPASYASIGIVDRVFTRVGAFDDLASGQSTFMVEMVELANILNNASERSLILLDEIGRGTSTYDGYSIAKAVVEYIHNKNKVGVRSLFATHYHQLTDLENNLERVKNYHIAVKEDGEKLVFLRKIVPGSTDKSYGIQVARLAGVPRKVTQRAKEILYNIEKEDYLVEKKKSNFKRLAKNEHKQLIFAVEQENNEKNDIHSTIFKELSEININELTPLDALNKLNNIQKKIKDQSE